MSLWFTQNLGACLGNNTAGIAAFYEDYYANKGVSSIKGTVAVGFGTNEIAEVTEVKLRMCRVLDADIVVVVGVGGRPLASLFKARLRRKRVELRLMVSSKRVFTMYMLWVMLLFPMKLYNDIKRVEHVDHSRKSAEHAVKSIFADEQGKSIDEYDYLRISIPVHSTCHGSSMVTMWAIPCSLVTATQHLRLTSLDRIGSKMEK